MKIELTDEAVRMLNEERLKRRTELLETAALIVGLIALGLGIYTYLVK